MKTIVLIISLVLTTTRAISDFSQQRSLAKPVFEKSTQVLESSLNTWGIDCADLNSDGAPDIVLATLDASSVLLFNNGKGVFQASSQKFPGDMHDVAIGDLDSDGHQDIFFVSVRQQKRPVYLNGGKGGFINTSFRAEASERVQLIDIDNDGDLDAYLGSRGTIYLNDGKGNFKMGGTSLPGFAVLADYDADGFIDLIAMGTEKEARGFAVSINDGKGNLKRKYFVPKSDLVFGYLEVADIDNDGDNDILYTNSGPRGTHLPSGILVNDGTGNFKVNAQTLPSASIYGYITASDLNNDGWCDIVITNQYRSPQIWLNDGNGKFVDSKIPIGEADGLTDCAAGDFDNDGDKDLFFVNRITGRHEVWFNRLSEKNTMPPQ